MNQFRFLPLLVFVAAATCVAFPANGSADEDYIFGKGKKWQTRIRISNMVLRDMWYAEEENDPECLTIGKGSVVHDDKKGLLLLAGFFGDVALELRGAHGDDSDKEGPVVLRMFDNDHCKEHDTWERVK